MQFLNSRVNGASVKKKTRTENWKVNYKIFVAGKTIFVFQSMLYLNIVSRKAENEKRASSRQISLVYLKWEKENFYPT